MWRRSVAKHTGSFPRTQESLLVGRLDRAHAYCVIPAQAGIHLWRAVREERRWIPACAGMTPGWWGTQRPNHRLMSAKILSPSLPPHPYFSRPFAKRGSDEELASGVLMGGVWPDAAFECPVRFPERFRTVKVETHFCSKRPMWDRGPMESSVGRPRHGQPAALVSGRRLVTARRRGGPLP